jgi:hypothetical protein
MTPLEERHVLVNELTAMAVKLRLAGDLIKYSGYCSFAQATPLPNGHSLTSALMTVTGNDQGWTDELLCRIAGMLLLTGYVTTRVTGSVSQLVDGWEGMMPPHRPTADQAIALLSATAASLENHASVVAFPTS